MWNWLLLSQKTSNRQQGELNQVVMAADKYLWLSYLDSSSHKGICNKKNLMSIYCFIYRYLLRQIFSELRGQVLQMRGTMWPSHADFQQDRPLRQTASLSLQTQRTCLPTRLVRLILWIFSFQAHMSKNILLFFWNVCFFINLNICQWLIAQLVEGSLSVIKDPGSNLGADIC